MTYVNLCLYCLFGIKLIQIDIVHTSLGTAAPTTAALSPCPPIRGIRLVVEGVNGQSWFIRLTLLLPVFIIVTRCLYYNFFYSSTLPVFIVLIRCLSSNLCYGSTLPLFTLLTQCLGSNLLYSSTLPVIINLTWCICFHPSIITSTVWLHTFTIPYILSSYSSLGALVLTYFIVPYSLCSSISLGVFVSNLLLLDLLFQSTVFHNSTHPVFIILTGHLGSNLYHSPTLLTFINLIWCRYLSSPFYDSSICPLISPLFTIPHILCLTFLLGVLVFTILIPPMLALHLFKSFCFLFCNSYLSAMALF